MNCLYIFRGSGSKLNYSLPQFSNSSIWMYGKEYKPPDPSNNNQSNSDNNQNNNNNSDNTDTTTTNTQDIVNSENITNTTNNNNSTDVNNNNNNNNQNNQNNGNEFIAEFLEDFSHKLWFSYRQGFPYIGNSTFENDCGWGCMLRSGQMLLSNIILLNQIGKDWRKTNVDIKTSENKTTATTPSTTPTSTNNGNTFEYPQVFYDVVKLFLDKPSAPFSIHNIAIHGQNNMGKNIGDWFAPSNISHTIKALVKQYNDQCNISVYVSDDGSLYVDQLLATSLKKDGSWIPLLILIPTKLGIDTINELYYRPLLHLFQFPQSLGIVGGKPRASLYFIASQDDNLFYLDPHTAQQAIDDESNFSLSSFFCSIPKKTNISEVDPSLVIPFFCRTKEEFLDFLERSKKLESSSEFPLFNITETAPDYQQQKTISMEGEEDYSSDDIEMEMDEWTGL